MGTLTKRMGSARQCRARQYPLLRRMNALGQREREAQRVRLRCESSADELRAANDDPLSQRFSAARGATCLRWRWTRHLAVPAHSCTGDDDPRDLPLYS